MSPHTFRRLARAEEGGRRVRACLCAAYGAGVELGTTTMVRLVDPKPLRVFSTMSGGEAGGHT